MKKLLATLLASTMALSAMGGLVACGGGDDAKTIKIWAPAASISAYQSLVADFKEENPDYKDWTFKFEPKEEGDVQTEMSDPKAGANIFFFPSDHLNNFVNKLKCLQPLTPEYETQVKDRDNQESYEFVTKTVNIGGEDTESIYAFPATDDNGYFLWYNSTQLSEDDIKTWDGLLDAAKEKGKKILFNYGDSYYAISFFLGTGTTFDYADDTLKEYTSNIRDNEGLVGANAYIKYFAPSRIGTGNNQLIVDLSADSALGVGLADGSVIAGVGGTWIKESVKTQMGDNYSNIKTAVLPTFTVGSTEYQMKSFVGSKYCGVNSTKSEDQILCSLAFANYLTSEKGQLARYNATGAGPTNNNLIENNETIKSDTVLETYRAQKDIGGYPQKDQPSALWNGINEFASQIVAGTTTATNIKSKLEELAASLLS